MNSCHFIGRLTKEPEAKKAESGITYCQFDIAVQRNKQKDASFIHCIAYEKVAQSVGKYSHKGDKVGVSGYLSPFKSTTKEGVSVEKYFIVCEEVEFLLRAKRDKDGGETDGD